VLVLFIVVEKNDDKIKEMFSLALENHKKNNFKVAVEIYQNILKIKPYDAVIYYNLGLIFEKYKDYIKAKDFYQKALEIKPNYIGAYNNLGLVYRELDDLKNAKDCFEKVLQLDPNYIAAIFNLGIIFREFGEFKEAISCYEKVIKLDPKFPMAHNNIGNAFKKLGENNKAVSHFEHELKVNPHSIDAQVNISNVYISQLNNLDRAVNSSHKALKMHHAKSKFINQSLPLYRLKHDAQQAEHLSKKNYNIIGIKEFIKTSNKILTRNENIEKNEDPLKKVLLEDDEVDLLLPFYKANFIYEPVAISNGCINPSKNWQNIEDEYFGSTNQIIYIDNFLSEQAIEEVRKFCLLSKIWIEERRNKYLGSFSDKGFVSKLHLQIAIELRNKLPRLFGKHRLGRFWGFKYDSSLGKGINIHADFALVNLNFWITPDEFNNTNAGGLKVYDTPAPEEWTFKKYNVNAEEIYKLLKKNKANCKNIPYKFNRAVLFNSDYFHETDQIDFKDDYEGRRLNITYLFGDRLNKR
jgi:Tfp pilus assembly protein PilF